MVPAARVSCQKHLLSSKASLSKVPVLPLCTCRRDLPKTFQGFALCIPL